MSLRTYLAARRKDAIVTESPPHMDNDPAQMIVDADSSEPRLYTDEERERDRLQRELGETVRADDDPAP